MSLLLIDLDESLLDRGQCFRAWAATFAADHGGGAETVDWLIAADEGGYRERIAFFTSVRERFALESAAEELLASYRDAYPRFMQPPSPEALARLVRLRAEGWRVAVVTNGSAVQTVKLHAAGVEHLIDACCISEVEGVSKPDPEIFRLAAKRCGCTLDGAWMIGDHPEYDIGGAHALGLRTVWLHHGREWTEPAYAPTATAATLAEALELVR
jgi:putative hydrolase of the HAD superfamily